MGYRGPLVLQGLSSRYSKRREFSVSSEAILEFLVSLMPEKLELYPLGFLTVDTGATSDTGYTHKLSVIMDDTCWDLAAAAFQRFAHREAS